MIIEDMNNMKTFETFLQEYWMENEAEGQTKDQCEDAEENWESNLDVQEVIDLADEYAKELVGNLKIEVQKYTNPKPEFDGITWDMIVNKLK